MPITPFAKSDPQSIVIGSSDKRDSKSNKYIWVQCPLCKSQREIRANKLSVMGHTYCYSCSRLGDRRGQKIGKLTALKYIPDSKKWLCKCECGNEKRIPKRNLKGDRPTKSCGCLRTLDGIDHPAYKDRIGQRFGRLVVLKYIGGKGHKRLCKCDCGNIVAVHGGALQSGTTKSCGCLNLERTSARMTGKNNPGWISELTEKERRKREEERVRGSEQQKFAKEVKSRDRNQCEICGGNKNVSAHHLYSYLEYPSLRNDHRNGIALCQDCHMEFHMWMGGYRIPCTPNDFFSWAEEKVGYTPLRFILRISKITDTRKLMSNIQN